MTSFRALLVSKTDEGQKVEITKLTEADLMDGDVTIKVEHSSVNYKDGLAITGKAPIIRRWPLIPGIDIAGTVMSSTHTDYKSGDKVVLGGWGVGEGHHGDSVIGGSEDLGVEAGNEPSVLDREMPTQVEPGERQPDTRHSRILLGLGRVHRGKGLGLEH